MKLINPMPFYKPPPRHDRSEPKGGFAVYNPKYKPPVCVIYSRKEKNIVGIILAVALVVVLGLGYWIRIKWGM